MVATSLVMMVISLVMMVTSLVMVEKSVGKSVTDMRTNQPTDGHLTWVGA